MKDAFSKTFHLFHRDFEPVPGKHLDLWHVLEKAVDLEEEKPANRCFYAVIHGGKNALVFVDDEEYGYSHTNLNFKEADYNKCREIVIKMNSLYYLIDRTMMDTIVTDNMNLESKEVENEV